MRLMFWMSVGLLLYTYAGYPFLLIVAGKPQAAEERPPIRAGTAQPARRRRSRRVPTRVDRVRRAQRRSRHRAEDGQLRASGLPGRLARDPGRLRRMHRRDGCARAFGGAAERVGLRVSRPRRQARGPQQAAAAGARRDRRVLRREHRIRARCHSRPSFGTSSGPRSAVSAVSSGCDRAAARPTGEQLYWRFETLLKFLESRLNMLVGANGALFAIRRSLFVPIPADGIVDDFLIAMNVRAAGYRVVYDPEAIAWEEVAPNARSRVQAARAHRGRQFSRAASHLAHAQSDGRRRGAGVLVAQSVPMAGAASFWSRLRSRRRRWRANRCTASPPRWVGVACCSRGWGYRLDLRARYWAPASIPYHFLSMNLALLLGLIAFVRGTQSIVWTPTARIASTPAVVVREPITRTAADVVSDQRMPLASRHARRRRCERRATRALRTLHLWLPGYAATRLHDVAGWRHDRRSRGSGSRLRIISSRGGAARTSEPRSNASSDGRDAGRESPTARRRRRSTALLHLLLSGRAIPSGRDRRAVATGAHGHRRRRSASASSRRQSRGVCRSRRNVHRAPPHQTRASAPR